MTELTFAREPLAGLLESGLETLLFEHWREVAHDQGVIALDPDWPAYFRAEQRGEFVAFGLRRDAVLIGYNCFYTLRSMHYRQAVFATNDVIYLKPEERGVEGIRMIAEAERELRKIGVTKTFYHTKADAVLGSPDGDSLEAIESKISLEEIVGDEAVDRLLAADRTLGAVLAALGYKHVENSFGKLLIGG